MILSIRHSTFLRLLTKLLIFNFLSPLYVLAAPNNAEIAKNALFSIETAQNRMGELKNLSEKQKSSTYETIGLELLENLTWLELNRTSIERHKLGSLYRENFKKDDTDLEREEKVKRFFSVKQTLDVLTFSELERSLLLKKQDADTRHQSFTLLASMIATSYAILSVALSDPKTTNLESLSLNPVLVIVMPIVFLGLISSSARAEFKDKKSELDDKINEIKRELSFQELFIWKRLYKQYPDLPKNKEERVLDLKKRLLKTTYAYNDPNLNNVDSFVEKMPIEFEKTCEQTLTVHPVTTGKVEKIGRPEEEEYLAEQEAIRHEPSLIWRNDNFIK